MENTVDKGACCSQRVSAASLACVRVETKREEERRIVGLAEKRIGLRDSLLAGCRQSSATTREKFHDYDSTRFFDEFCFRKLSYRRENILDPTFSLNSSLLVHTKGREKKARVSFEN